MSSHMMGAFEKLICQIQADAVDREQTLDDLRAIRQAIEIHFWPIGRETFRSGRGKLRVHVVPASLMWPEGERAFTQVAVHVYSAPTARNPSASFVIGCPDADRAHVRAEALMAIGEIS